MTNTTKVREKENSWKSMNYPLRLQKLMHTIKTHSRQSQQDNIMLFVIVDDTQMPTNTTCWWYTHSKPTDWLLTTTNDRLLFLTGCDDTTKASF